MVRPFCMVYTGYGSVMVYYVSELANYHVNNAYELSICLHLINWVVLFYIMVLDFCNYCSLLDGLLCYGAYKGIISSNYNSVTSGLSKF